MLRNTKLSGLSGLSVFPSATFVTYRPINSYVAICIYLLYLHLSLRGVGVDASLSNGKDHWPKKTSMQKMRNCKWSAPKRYKCSKHECKETILLNLHDNILFMKPTKNL
jgi:hypothetical protein